jgi:GTP cyclohydrolase II
MMSSTPISAEVLKLFGDRDQTPVERAIAELRAGRAVLIAHAAGTLALAPAESASDAMLAGLRATASNGVRLLLSATRLHYLGVQTASGTMALDAAAFDPARINALIRLSDTTPDAPLLPAGPAADSALALLRLALLLPAALVCDISPALASGLAAVTVTPEAIAAYAAGKLAGIHIVSRAPVPLFNARKAEFVVFRGGEGLREQIAIVVGEPDPATPVLVRLHSACLTGDLFGSLRCDCGDQLRNAVKTMAEQGGGVLLYLDQEGRGNGIANKMRAYRLQYDGLDTYDADRMLGFEDDGRHFDFAAEMLRQLGYGTIKLMTNNPAKAAALARAGITVAATQRIYGRLSAENISYLEAKRDHAGHLVDPANLIDTLIEAAE